MPDKLWRLQNNKHGQLVQIDNNESWVDSSAGRILVTHPVVSI